MLQACVISFAYFLPFIVQEPAFVFGQAILVEVVLQPPGVDIPAPEPDGAGISDVPETTYEVPVGDKILLGDGWGRACIGGAGKLAGHLSQRIACGGLFQETGVVAPELIDAVDEAALGIDLGGSGEAGVLIPCEDGLLQCEDLAEEVFEHGFNGAG